YGANASYLEDLQARYQSNPASIDPRWAEFFRSLGDPPGDIVAGARGAPWQRSDWPLVANGELLSALGGNWQPVERAVDERIRAKAQANGATVSDEAVQRAARDSVRA